MTRFDRALDVLRVVIPPANDDQVFQPAGHEQLSAPQEAEVAGPQERPLARVAQSGSEDLLSFFGPIPVTGGDARPRNPNFADLAGRALHQPLRIHDGHMAIRADLT